MVHLLFSVYNVAVILPHNGSAESSGKKLSKHAFIIGSTGFMGRALTEELLKRGHRVDALARRGSEKKVPPGATVITGDPLDHRTYVSRLKPSHTIVQLAGVSHPSPFKADQFEKIDFVCGRESVLAARVAGVHQIVYVSVAQPAPIMKAYVEARAEVERLIRENKLDGTVLRPWYVLGPGRWWPVIMLPIYWIFENQSATREWARRLGLVSLRQMVNAMVRAIEHPVAGLSVWDVPEIKRNG